jgi:hypothetical protein
MTGTDERRNSRSRSGTPTRGGTPIPQPVFQPSVGFNEGHRDPPAPIPHHPPYGDDPFGANPAVEERHFISLNDDDDDDMSQIQMPAGRNAAPLPIPNVRGGVGPLSQEGQLFEWQLGPPPALPGPPPVPQPNPAPAPQPNPPPVPQPNPPPAPQPNPLPAPSQNLPLAQPPARRVAGARRIQRNPARQEHPQYPDKIWCTKGRHWVLKTVFGNLLTCLACRAADHARGVRLKEQRAMLAAAAAAELQLNAQIGENVPQANPAPAPPPPPQQQPFDPLSAVSPEDKILLGNCRDKLMAISMESCNLCHEEWFDLDVINGVCRNCRKGSTFQPSNNMYPGDGASHLPELTQMEEMLISPVHALVQLWQIRGGQTKYTGHICNFPRENAVFHAKVPLLPEECDIMIMRRTGVQVGNDEAIYQDF